MSKYFRSVFATWKTGLFAGVGLVTGVGGVVYVLRHPLRSDTVNQTADVASEALSDVRLRQQAIVLSKEVVSNVLRNEESLALVQDLLLKLLQKEETRNGLMMLLRNVFEDPYMQETTKQFVLKIIMDDWIQERLQDIVRQQAKDLLRDEGTRDVMIEFLKSTSVSALDGPEVQEKATSAARGIVKNFFIPWR